MNCRLGRTGMVTTAVVCLFWTVSTGSAQTKIVVPAESFTGQGGGNVGIRTGTDAVPGYIHLWYTPGHWVEWSFEAPAIGEYELRVKYGTRFDALRKVELNGEVVKGLESFTFGNTGGWISFKEEKLPVRIALKSGKNTLKMTCVDHTSLCVTGIALTTPGKPDVVVDPLRFSGQGGGKVQVTVGNENGFFTQWDSKGHWLEWTVEIPTEGQYRTILQYAALKKPVREVRVNGRVVPGMAAVTFDASSGWRNWVEGTLPGPLPLKGGANVVRLTNVEQGQNLTAIVLKDPAGKETIIPAVNFSGQGGGKVAVHGAPKCGAICNWDGPGHWLEWTVEIPVAGRYNLALRYATTASLRRALEVNGQAVKGLEFFTVARGANWEDWLTATLDVPVTLRVGKNIVRLTSIYGDLWLDELVFTLKE